MVRSIFDISFGFAIYSWKLHYLNKRRHVNYINKIVFVLVIVFKSVHGLAPNYLAELVHVHHRDSRLRQAQHLTLSEQVANRVIGMLLGFRHPDSGIGCLLMSAPLRTYIRFNKH